MQRYFVNVTAQDGRRWEVWFSCIDYKGINLTYKPWLRNAEARTGGDVATISVPEEVIAEGAVQIAALIKETARTSIAVVEGRKRGDNRSFLD